MVDGQNKLVLHDIEIDRASEFGTNSMADIDPCVDTLRGLFDKVCLRFQNDDFSENKKGENIVPYFFGDGQPLDLFKIFWAVWNKGGCDFVSENGLWGSVAEECKIDCNIADEYVKTVYMKYISELDRSFKSTINTKLLEKSNAEDGNLGLLVSELQEEFSGFLQGEKKKNDEIVVSEQESGRKYHDVDNLDGNEVSKIVEKSQKTSNGFKKRKRDSTSLSEMVDWVAEVAKHPDDSKWKNHRKKDFWSQALLAREALTRLSHYNSTTEDSQKKLKMDSSMYEASNNNVRNCERVNSVAKPRISPCCNSSSTVHNNVVSPLQPFSKNNPKQQADPDIEILETNHFNCLSDKENTQKQTSVGPNFQAQVPKWTGVVSESNSKWLGTRMWHPANEKYENNFLENGKNKSCGCRFPSSVACVRFHIAENRVKLRREIGSLFHKWNFHRMGEEVSLSWTIEEERRFKLMERLDLSGPGACFWDNIAKFFPEKSKENLVSYYFNVFLIGRRAYQNRVTPNDVDSDDDDESVFGRVGGRFGNEAPCFGQ